MGLCWSRILGFAETMEVHVAAVPGFSRRTGRRDLLRSQGLGLGHTSDTFRNHL